MSDCTTYAYPIPEHLTRVTCQRAPHHKGKHRAQVQVWNVDHPEEQPVSQFPLAVKTATIEWE
jgi:hypothetical protein